MTGDRRWERAGMGRTGETFVVGKDDLMRSDSRLFLQDPEAYKADVIKAGTPPATAERAIKQGTTVLIQPVGTKATEAAQRGETGTLIANAYLGQRALQAYAPLHLKGLDWVIVAAVDSDEAFAPERNFAHKLVRSTALIIFLACLAAMIWSRLFVRPIKRLEDGAEKVSTGDYDVRIPVDTNDEFGDLSVAFNEMGRNLAVKHQLLNEQRAENDRLLMSLMPESVVERYRDGEQNIAEDHQDVTVIYADLIGVDELSADLDAGQSLKAINKLVRQFDAAAESNGIERVRNTHNGYLASCGLTVPRLDNIHRTVDFALEMQRIVDRFNTEMGADIKLCAGVDTGDVTSGLVGRAGLVYDLWGGAVHLASRMRRGLKSPGIYVSQGVYDATRDSLRYTPAGTITVGDREEPTWRLAEDRQ
jgi:class 3 adenylate cyclase